MPIQLPDLDRLTFDELRKELVTAIPKLTGEWTNFNPSDPGITILEMLAWITKTLLYRADLIPEDSYLKFLQLVAGSDVVYDPFDQGRQRIREYLQHGAKEIHTMKTETRRFLNSRYRAVTRDDFAALTLEAASALKQDEVFAVFGAPIQAENKALVLDALKRVEVFTAYDKVTIVLIPANGPVEGMGQLAEAIRDYLKPHCLLGTVLEVKPAEYITLDLKIMIVCKNSTTVNPDAVTARVKDAVKSYLDPITGGPDGAGWPYGRNLMVYELFYIVEGIEGVDHVEAVYKIGPDDSEQPFTAIPVPGLIDPVTLEVEVVRVKGNPPFLETASSQLQEVLTLLR